MHNVQVTDTWVSGCEIHGPGEPHFDTDRKKMSRLVIEQLFVLFAVLWNVWRAMRLSAWKTCHEELLLDSHRERNWRH